MKQNMYCIGPKKKNARVMNIISLIMLYTQYNIVYELYLKFDALYMFIGALRQVMLYTENVERVAHENCLNATCITHKAAGPQNLYATNL